MGNRQIETVADKYISSLNAIKISARGYHFFIPKQYMGYIDDFEVPEGFHEKSNTVNSKFELGRMVITANANKELDIPSVLQILLARYMQGDWGNLCESDKQLNDSALKYGDRIFASYTDANDRKFWIITEADRSATTVLLPEDY